MTNVRGHTRRMAKGLALATMFAASLLATGGAHAQGKVLIRDAETEALLQDYVLPIFKVAGVRSSAVELYILQDPSFNAFVASGQKIVVNTGAVIDSKAPNELIGVLAHETGHLAGGHQVQLRQQAETAQRLAMLGGIAGIGAAVAGAAARRRGDRYSPTSAPRKWPPTSPRSTICSRPANRRRG